MADVRAALTNDDAVLQEWAVRLADGVEAALPGWVVGHVERLAEAWSGQVGADVGRRAEAAGARARAEVGSAVRTLLVADVDAQRTNPLSIVRSAVTYPTEVLVEAGVPPVERDPFAERAFPTDVYDLVPAGFADLSPDLAEVGLAWGAAKAYVVLNRRRAEGRR